MCPLLFIGAHALSPDVGELDGPVLASAHALGHRAIKDHVNNGSTNKPGRKIE